MSSRWERPKPRVYEYNYKIQSDYYRPTLANLDTGKKATEAKTFAEESSETNNSSRQSECEVNLWKRDTSTALKEAKAYLQELEEKELPPREPLWRKHPFYVPEESVVVPPHESSVWPESRPHFHLVSSYDVMVGYLGIKGMGQRAAERQRRLQQQQ